MIVKITSANNNMEKVKKIIMHGHRIIVREIAADVGLCQQFIGYSVHQNFVSIEVSNNPELLKRVKTSDASRVYECDFEATARMLQWRRVDKIEKLNNFGRM